MGRRQADIEWWKESVKESADKYMKARGKAGYSRLNADDLAQISAAAGCRVDVAKNCLKRIEEESKSQTPPTNS